MKRYLYKAAEKIGIDKAVFFTSSARIIQGLGGIVSVIFVARYLTGVEQGFYYTFASILAVQIFFELGLNNIITQYVAHEASHLEQNGDTYQGPEKYHSRMASILRFCVKWYTWLGVMLLVVLFVTGWVFFNFFGTAPEDLSVNWVGPWFLLCIGTTLLFAVSPILAFIEGLGKVKEIAKYRLMQQLLGSVIIWCGLFGGIKLYAGGLSTIISGTVLIWLVSHKFRALVVNIYNYPVKERVSYKREIFPFQWKIALSWIGGYFIFQLFNPVLFATHGPVVAGQMGLTLSLMTSVLALSYSWISTKIPLYSGLIAQHDYKTLDGHFRKTFIQSVLIYVLISSIALAAIACIQEFHLSVFGIYIQDRILPMLPLGMLMVGFLMNNCINAWAVYLRCHKREPLLIHSLVFGLFSCLSTLVLAPHYGAAGITIGYSAVAGGAAIWAYYIFKTKQRLWHQ